MSPTQICFALPFHINDQKQLVLSLPTTLNKQHLQLQYTALFGRWAPTPLPVFYVKTLSIIIYSGLPAETSFQLPVFNLISGSKVI